MREPIEPKRLGKVISEETGLEFGAVTGVDGDGQRWYLLRPQGNPADYTFGIRTTLGWRRLQIQFEPGKFAAALLGDMGNADADGRSAFHSVLKDCFSLGATCKLEINGNSFPFDSDKVWTEKWNRIVLSMSKGQLELGTDQGDSDADIICEWTGRFTAAIIAILPMEESNDQAESEVVGYPEGAMTTVQTNRYERDRRNRAAAIAIHGTTCNGCGLEMGTRYGSIAAGLIDIHHVTPVSKLAAGYIIDPKRDLVPLCPNCHAVVHRQVPPLTVNELRKLYKHD
ncbi:MAG: HNH endonuclease [Gammaproteobacteria bacterium]|nr:HNH endonuclease [Gammaproteobacteria bacterium]MXX06901.1 HNH endonuclease [Gammaproteobacteria bacterium]MYE29075.1 HNH endonuclease [Gammaproteobacteria bacterium]